MNTNELIARLVEQLSSVEHDTNYGLHDGDYVIPFGKKGIIPGHMTAPCECALCLGREYLDASALRDGDRNAPQQAQA